MPGSWWPVHGPEERGRPGRRGEEQPPPRNVQDANLKRRHMTPSATAMAAARSLEMFEAAARKRQGERTDIRAKLSGSSEKPPERRARAAAAAPFKASPRNVQDAKKVIAKGVPALAKAAEKGREAGIPAVNVGQTPAREFRRVPISELHEAPANARR